MITLVQLYSARDHLPWESVLDQIAQLGFDGVEGFFASFEEPAEFRAALEARGLTMPQAHLPLVYLEQDFDQALAGARALGVHVVIAPWLPADQRPGDVAGWQALGRRLDAIEARLRAQGLRFAWHNHDFEFLPLADGRCGLDILLAEAPGMDWQADLGWMLRGGVSPVPWLHRHAGRIVSVHLKDVQAETEGASEGGWADLGHGLTDWRPIFAAMAGLPRLSSQVAEHDNPADLGRFLSRWKVAQEGLTSDRPGLLYEGFGHVTLMCRDLEGQLAFYRDVLGLAEMFRLVLPDGRQSLALRLNDRQHLELWAGASAPGSGGWHQIGLQVADLQDSLASLRKRGLGLSAPDGTALVPEGGDPIAPGADGNRRACFTDPEGNRIVLIEMARNSLQARAVARLRRD